MARPKKDTYPAAGDKGKLRSLRDGLFYADNKRADWSEVFECDAGIAAILIERGDAKYI
jgi:hypothetical protein